MSFAWQRFAKVFLLLVLVLGLVVLFVLPHISWARNINQYKDTISTSAPGRAANHTLSFRIDTNIPPEGYIDITPPPGFSIIASPTFSPLRSVEVLVDGVRRDVGSVLSAVDDTVSITPGSPGTIRYTLNQVSGISAGSEVVLKIGNHTSMAETGFTSFSTTTGTTTVPADVPGIINSADVGTHAVDVRVYDNVGTEIANAGFVVALVDQVGVGPVDTTEDIPPERFNGQPSGELSGTTVNVEISLETNEFAICRYSQTPDTDYTAMTNTFSNTGLVFHTNIVAVIPSSVNRFYIRCMDDEGNMNTDDYIIQFSVNARPTGEVNSEGTNNGTGSGSGNSGTGAGQSTGNTTSSGSGSGTTAGSSGGGSGGGGGGGFESSPGPFRSGDAQVVISGLASPRARVSVLVDGRSAATANAGTDGSYSVTVERIARGAYTFGIFATDVAGTKSSTFSTSFTVTGARESTLSNINIPPSILVTPNPVNPGQALTISGYTLPNAKVTIENEKDRSPASRKSFNATANGSGQWSIPIDTGGFSNGTYKVRAKAEQGIIFTNFSQPTLYGVGTPTSAGGNNSDLNRDGKINLTDFSILLFWWNSNGGDSNPPADISQDGRVNLTDFSILLFNWTG